MMGLFCFYDYITGYKDNIFNKNGSWTKLPFLKMVNFLFLKNILN